MSSTLQTQRALARIYLDRPLRATLLAGDVSSLLRLGLGEQEAQNLVAMLAANERQIDLFAEMLRNKREHKLRSYFPILIAALGADEWERVWAAYCDGNPVSQEGAVDAIGFAAFVEQNVHPEAGTLLGDALEYEKTKAVISSWPAPPLRADPECDASSSLPLLVPPSCVKAFRHCPARMRRWAVGQDVQAPPAGEDLVHILFFRAHDGNVKAVRVAERLGAVLKSCDGTKSIAELAAEVEAGGKAGFIQLSHTLKELASRGALAFVESRGLQ